VVGWSSVKGQQILEMEGQNHEAQGSEFRQLHRLTVVLPSDSAIIRDFLLEIEEGRCMGKYLN